MPIRSTTFGMVTSRGAGADVTAALKRKQVCDFPYRGDGGVDDVAALPRTDGRPPRWAA